MRTDEQLNRSVTQSKQWKGAERFSDIFGRREGARRSPSFSGHERNHLFMNFRGGRFSDLSTLSGLDSEADGRSFVWWDYDRDGWLDIALVNANRPLLNLFRNQIGEQPGAANQQMIGIRLVGGNRTATATDAWSTRDGYGAEVLVSLGEMKIGREHRCGEGFAGQNSGTMVIGIGAHTRVDVVEIEWPSGKTSRRDNVDAGTLLTVYEDAAESTDGSGFEPSSYRLNLYGKASPLAAVSHSPVLNFDLPCRPPETNQPALRMYTTMATWCSACKKQLPQLQLLRKTFSEDRLAMYGVPIDEDDVPDQLSSYVKRHQPGYRILLELSSNERASVSKVLQTMIRSEPLPSSIVTNAQGKVLRVFRGVPTTSDLRRLSNQ